MDIKIIFDTISVFICLLEASIALLVIWKFKSLDPIFKNVGYYFILSFLFDIWGLWLGKIQHQNNLFLFHIFSIIEFYLMSQFYFDFYASFGMKTHKNWLITAVLSCLIINSCFIQPIHTFNSHGLTLVSLSLMAYSLLAFYWMIEHSTISYYIFEIKWLIITFFFLNAGSLMVLFFSNQISHLSRDQQLIIWLVRSFIILLVKGVQCYIIHRIVHKSRLKTLKTA